MGPMTKQHNVFERGSKIKEEGAKERNESDVTRYQIGLETEWMIKIGTKRNGCPYDVRQRQRSYAEGRNQRGDSREGLRGRGRGRSQQEVKGESNIGHQASGLEQRPTLHNRQPPSPTSSSLHSHLSKSGHSTSTPQGTQPRSSDTTPSSPPAH